MDSRYQHEEEIAARVETVYDVLTDFARYPDWNPWFTRMEGELLPGSILHSTVRSLHNAYPLKHRLLVADRPHQLVWRDSGWQTLFFCGERSRVLIALPDGRCLYRCELCITGVVSALVDALFGRTLQACMVAEADALRQRCEALQKTSNSLFIKDFIIFTPPLYIDISTP